MIRGPVGGAVKLVVERNGGTRIPFTLERGDIHVNSVQRPMVLDEGVGYLSLSSFSDSTALEVRAAVDSLVGAGATSLVLDLRGNPGGLLDQGVAVADLFLREGQKIVSTRGRSPGTNSIRTSTARRSCGRRCRWSSCRRRHRQRGRDRRRRAAGPRPRARARAPDLRQGKRAERVPLEEAARAQAHDRALVHAVRAQHQPSARRARRRRRRPPTPTRPLYKTDHGRTVFGGGGILPDVLAGDCSPPSGARLVERRRGARRRCFARRSTTWPRPKSVRRGAVKDPEFVVTPDDARGSAGAGGAAPASSVSRSAFDAGDDAVDRQLGNELARQAFGLPFADRRVVRNDTVVQRAASLLRAAADPRGLLRRVPAAADTMANMRGGIRITESARLRIGDPIAPMDGHGSCRSRGDPPRARRIPSVHCERSRSPDSPLRP